MNTTQAIGGRAPLEIQKRESSLTREHYRVLSLSTLGGLLEFYEFVVFIFLTPIISQLFFPADIPLWVRQLQTLAIFAVGYLMRPLGGIFLANLGDIFGRKRIFALSLFLMAVPTLAIGLLPTYVQIGLWAPVALLLCRMVQGLALGGELPGALTFISEHVPEKRLGISVALLGAALTVGTLLASSVIAGLGSNLSRPEMLAYGWRIPFLLGGAFGLISVYLRRYVHETPVFQKMQERKTVAKEMPIKLLFKTYRKEVLLCILIGAVLAAIVPAVFLYSPTYLQTYLHLDPKLVHAAHPWSQFGLIAGILITGWLVDRVGLVRVVMVTSAAALISIYWFYIGLPSAPQSLPYRYLVVGLLFSYVVPLYVLLIRSFPAPVRFTGISVTYNLGAAVIGGLTPLMLAALSHYDKLAPAHYAAFFTALAFVLTPLVWRLRKPIAGMTAQAEAA